MKKNSARIRFIYYTSIICFSLFLFLILQPHMLTVFSKDNSELLESFVTTSVYDKKMNDRNFWELREFYAPGSFILKKQGFTLSELSSETLDILADDISTKQVNPFLTYKSEKWESVELLIDQGIQKEKLIKNLNGKEVLLNTNSDLMYKDGNVTYMVFIRPISEMQKTNGYLDYKEHDLKLIKNKNWAVISVVK